MNQGMDRSIVRTARTRRSSSGDMVRSSLTKMVRTCASTVFFDRNSCFADRAVRSALGHQRQHLAFPSGQRVEPGDDVRGAPEQPGDDGRVDDAFAVHQSAQRVDAPRRRRTPAPSTGSRRGPVRRRAVGWRIRTPDSWTAPGSRRRDGARGSPARRRFPRRYALVASGCRRSPRPAGRVRWRGAGRRRRRRWPPPRSRRRSAGARDPGAAGPNRRRSLPAWQLRVQR